MKEAIELTGVPRDEKPSATDFRVLTELPSLIDSPYPRIAIGDLIDVARLFDPTIGEDEILPFQMEMFRIQQDYSPPGSTFMAISSRDLVRGLEDVAVQESKKNGIAIVYLDRYMGEEQTGSPFHRLNISRGKNDTIVARPGFKQSPGDQIEELRSSVVAAGTEEILLIDDVLAYATTLVPIINMLQSELPNVRIRAAVALASSGGEWSGIEKVEDKTGIKVEAQTVVKVSPKTKYSSGMGAPTSRDMTIFGGALDNSGKTALSYPHIYPFAIPRPSFFDIDRRHYASAELLSFNLKFVEFLGSKLGRKITIKDLINTGFGIPASKIQSLQGSIPIPPPEFALVEYLNKAREVNLSNQTRIDAEAKTADDISTFKDRKKEVAEICRMAFEGHPWYEKLTVEESLKRIVPYLDMEGFGCVISETDGEITGALWYNSISVDDLESEKGKSLADFARGLLLSKQIRNVVFTRETVVDPKHQGKGFASKLKSDFISQIEALYPDGALILTRHRSDNPAIIKTSEKLGYEKTGIRMPSSQNPNAHHEYWYKIIRPTK